jgi:methylated-DNA-[protein]-cysteine S-methyltransferase
MTSPSSIHAKNTSLAVQLIHIGRLTSSPIGPLCIAVSTQGIRMVGWDMSQVDFSHLVRHRFHANVVYDESRTSEALNQLVEYLTGNRRQFTLPLDLSGMTTFQANVLRLTSLIPNGATSTYKEIAFKWGNEHAARAVGRAEATNPIPLIIPCHRVLGSDGSLHGYGGPGGIKLKAWLLQMEQSSG